MNPNLQSVDIAIAGTVIRLVSDDEPFLQDLLAERYEAFVFSAAGEPDIHIRLHCSPSPPTRARPETVQVRRAEGGWRFVYNSFVADVSDDASAADLTCLRNAYTVDSFLRALLALYLPFHQGVLMHAGALRHEGRGYVFAGRSGAGKSTVAKLLKDDADVLSDELVAIRQTSAGWLVYGTPFWGEFARAGINQHALLGLICLLAKDTRHSLEPLPRRDALTALLQCSVQFGEGARIAEAMLNTVSALVRVVPVYRLRFLPDKGFWALVLQQS